MDPNPSDLWQDGNDARHAGRPVLACPFTPDTDFSGRSDVNAGADWVHGWYAPTARSVSEHRSAFLRAWAPGPTTTAPGWSADWLRTTWDTIDPDAARTRAEFIRVQV